jgi:hypothetical protein
VSAIRDRQGLIATELRNPAGLAIELLDNGSLFAIRHRDILINQVLGSPVEGGLGNVYLRRRTRHGISSVPLLGTRTTPTGRAACSSRSAPSARRSIGTRTSSRSWSEPREAVPQD